MATKPPLPHGDPAKRPRASAAMLWFVLLALLVWNLVSFMNRAQPAAAIPYTTFLGEVRRGNVTQVQIRGDAITGTFAVPLRWPPAETSPSPRAAARTAPLAHATPAEAASSAAKPGATGSAQVEPFARFKTLFPEAVGDPHLIATLEAHHVTVTVLEPSKPWFVTMLVDWGPMLLLVGYFVWMARKASLQQGGILGFGRTKARRYTGESSAVTFADVAGADEAKTDLEGIVDFLRNPKKYHEIGARIPRGVLLVGPPGTGKTLLGRAVAGEAAVPFYNISASEFVEMFVGVGASRVRDLFVQAKTNSPAIVFIDELDAVGRRRGAGVGAVNDEREQTLNQLLVEMDGFDERHEVIILAATNRPDVLDPALQRPGRFDRQVIVGPPDRTAREGVLRIHTREIRLGDDIDLAVVARSTTGMSGADLANLCNEAALLAAANGHTQVAMSDFEEALDKIVLGGARHALLDPNERKVVAYHESGHALVAWLTPEADPVHKVTIIPRGRALGVTEQLPGEDRTNFSRSYLLARLDVLLAGRASEELILGEVTTGAESDLVQATRLTRRMVTRWGMGSLGPLAFAADEEQPFLGYQLSQARDYSEATAARIDRDMSVLLEQRKEVVTKLLAANRATLDQLAEALLRDETIGSEALRELIGPKAGAALRQEGVEERSGSPLGGSQAR
jgi:cell division protease FtsH